ncbi:MAG: type VI secretion system tip protein TssI/VgrG [Planctomycetota bacterium]
MKFDQSKRLIQISGPFASDEVCAISFSANEAISRLFSCRLQFLCSNLDLVGKNIIGQKITVEIQRIQYDGSELESRFFNGYVSRLSGSEMTTAQTEEYRTYEVEIVPWLWFLTQTSTCHTFFPDQPSKSIKSIIESVFNRSYHESGQWSIEAQGIENVRVEQCVQYRETDFNFVSRILEQYGVYYYFEHSQDDHKLILCDKPNYPSCLDKEVKYRLNQDSVAADGITSWERQYQFASGKYAHTDYNFEKATENLDAKSPKISAEQTSDVDNYELFDYPGEYSVKGNGDTEARIRQEEEEVGHDQVQGTSKCRGFCAGFKFNLTEHLNPKQKKRESGEYLLTSVQHNASQRFDKIGTNARYSNSYTCIPANLSFRPSRITPKPIISGVQTGVVTGPDSEEIYTDKYGRVKVLFHWDRVTRGVQKKINGNCSCWVRVAQHMAGRKYGFMSIPRIGQEVVVEFLEGDPDRPLITGSVYNSDQPPHYDPEEHKTRTYLKTNTSLGGDGFNELMFEDLADKEMIFMHAERNMDVRVLNNSTETIHNSRYEIVGEGLYDHQIEGSFDGGDFSQMVTRDKFSLVLRDQHDHIEGTYKLMVGNGSNDNSPSDPGVVDFVIEDIWRSSVGEGGSHRTIEGDENGAINGSKSTAVKGDFAHSSQSYSSETKMNTDMKAGMDFAIEGGMNVHTKSGMTTVIEGGMGVTLKCGGNFVSLTPAGIFIKGPLVGINSGGAAGSGPGCSPVSPTAPEEPEEAAPMGKATFRSHNEKTGMKSRRD